MRTLVVAVLAAVWVVSAAAAWAGDGDCRVIVGMKHGANASRLARAGLRVDRVDGRVAAGRLPPGRIAALRASAEVAYVEEDSVVRAQAQKVTWGVQAVWGGTGTPTYSGAGVKVAVVDTGIDLSHPDLKANVAGGKSFVSGTFDGNDDNGHGTHVAGVVAAVDNGEGVIGVAPRARLYAVKVLDRRGSGYLSSVAAGLDWAATNGMHVANLSLGSATPSSTLSASCQNALSRGVVVIAAAGNSGDGSTTTVETTYPAAYPSVVAVGAFDSYDKVATWSNTGPYVYVSAPGTSIYSTYRGGAYVTMSGTSMAAPHVAGMAAVLRQEILARTGLVTATAVRTALSTRVRDLGPLGRDNGFGFGATYFR